MKRKAPSSKNKAVIAFASATALLATPVAASERTRMEDGTYSVDVYSLNQAEASKMLADFRAQAPDAQTRDNILAKFNYLKAEITKDAQTHGYTAYQAERIAGTLAGSYTISRAVMPDGTQVIKTFDDLNPSAINGLTPVTRTVLFYDNDKKVTGQVCTIAAPARNHTLEMWLKSFTQISNIDASALPAAYQPMITDMVNFHEQAHCFGADENASDYIAALRVLNKYRSTPETTQNFLRLFSGTRNFASEFRNVSQDYLLAGSYIQMAADDFKANPDKYKTDKDILALINNNGIPDLVRAQSVDEAHFMNSLKEMAESLKVKFCNEEDAIGEFLGRRSAPKNCIK